MKKNRKIFYGWWILIACFFLSGGGVGILINSMGTFIKPVSEALNYSRAKLSLATSLSSFAGMLLYPVWGSYMKNHSIRKAMICTGFLIPLIFLAFSFCRQLWQFYLCAILIGCMTGSISTLPITTIINHTYAFMTDIGMGEKHASLMVSLQMLSLMVSKLMLGTIMDKKGLRFGFMLSLYGYVLAGLFLLLGAYYTPMAYFAVVCSGIGGAIPAMSIAYTTQHLFGSREYSALCSVVLSFGFLGQAMGTTINGIIFDLTGSYKLGWLLVMAEALLMILLFLTVLKKTAHQLCGSNAAIANIGERR